MALSAPMPLLQASPARRNLISLTPLIDVVFILLIFYLLAIRADNWTAIEISQVGSTSTANSNEDTQVLNILENNRVEYRGRTLSLEQFSEEISKLDSAVVIQVIPETAVQLQTTVKVLDVIAAAPSATGRLKVPKATSQ